MVVLEFMLEFLVINKSYDFNYYNRGISTIPTSIILKFLTHLEFSVLGFWVSAGELSWHIYGWNYFEIYLFLEIKRVIILTPRH